MAESVVVADNVELVAHNIQSKVGATLLGTKNLAADAVGVSEPSVRVLESIRDFTSATANNVQAVWDLLLTQLQFEQDEARFWREQGGGLANTGIRGGEPKGLEAAAMGKAGSSIGGGIMDTLKTVGTTLFTIAGLKLLVSKIFTGALWGLMFAMAGSALVKKFEMEDTAMEDAVMTTLPTMAALMAMFNIKKAMLLALPVIAAVGIASLVSWLTGDKLADDISGFQWGSVALTGPAAVMLAKAFGAKFTLAGGLTLGTAIIGMPVIIAASIAIALAAGVGFLNSKVKGIEETMLNHLGESTKLTQEEFERRLDEQRSSYLAQLSPGLAKLFGQDLTMGQEVLLASERAKDKSRLEGKKGDFNQDEVQNIVKSVDQFTSLYQETLRATLDDKHRADELMKFIHNMYIVAQSGKLGEQNSANMFKKLSAMSQNIQMTAKQMQEEKYGGDTSIWRDDYLAEIAQDKGDIAVRGDYVERYANYKASVKPLEDKRSTIMEDERFQKLSAMNYTDVTDDEDRKYLKEKRKELSLVERQIKTQYNQWRDMYSGTGPEKGKGVDVEKLLMMLPEDVRTKIISDALSDKKIDILNSKNLKPDNIPDNNKGSIHVDNKSNASNQNNHVVSSTINTSPTIDHRINQALAG